MRFYLFALPIMLIVGSFSWLYLSRNFQEIEPLTRVFISVGAIVVSGVISYFLFPKNEEPK